MCGLADGSASPLIRFCACCPDIVPEVTPAADQSVFRSNVICCEGNHADGLSLLITPRNFLNMLRSSGMHIALSSVTLANLLFVFEKHEQGQLATKPH